MMSCEIIKTNIPSLLVGRLSADESHRVLRHMEECMLCRNEIEELALSLLAF